MSNQKVPLSVLDLVPVGEGFTISDAIQNSTKLAQAVERFGYERYWVAEHHNFAGIASAATSVVLSYIGSQTQTIRIGSGGIMLPNHAPLVIAEQFGTLETLYPNRIDLGLGRAPGTDRQTMLALRRDPHNDGSQFPMMLEHLQYFLSHESQEGKIKAIPGFGLDIPIWLLGSSTFSAKLAAQKGLPFAFAAHFAPDALEEALAIYHENFKPSKQLDAPYAMVCINVICAPTQEEAEFLATTELQKFLYLHRGDNRLAPKPTHDMDSLWEAWEAQSIKHKTRESIWGTPDVVKARLEQLIERTGVKEVMVNAMIHDPDLKIRSYELLSKVWFDR